MIKSPLFSIAICLSIISSACTKSRAQKQIFMSGEIDKLLVDKLETQNQIHAEILIHSTGGNPDPSLRFAELIIKSKNSIVVNGDCISACAEYVLPAASSIEMRNDPLIGFHWNAMMIEELMRNTATKDVEYCEFRDSKKLRQLQKNMGVNHNFWKQVLLKLENKKYFVEYRPGRCPWKKMNFRNRLWFPTSRQLREDYNLSFEGAVCADDYDKCLKKIDRRWSAGRRFIIGNRPYVVGEIKTDQFK